MLVNQTQSTMASAGASSATAHITDTVKFTFTLTGLCVGGAEINSDGVLSLFNGNGSLSSVSGEWLVSGANTDFFLQATTISGSLNAGSSVTDSFLAMTSTRTYQGEVSVGDATLVMYYEFATDAGGTPVVATATHTYTMEVISGAL